MTAARPVRLPAAGLEHVQLAALDGELQILHVAVGLLKLRRELHELLVDGRRCASFIAEIGSALRMPATTSSPWAFARKLPYSTFSPVFGSRVNATPVPESSPMLPKTIVWTLTAVPQVVGDLLGAAVVDRAVAHPGAEDGLDRELELIQRVAREVGAGLGLDDLLELGDDLAQAVGVRSVSSLDARASPSPRRARGRTSSVSMSRTIRPNMLMKRR